MGKTYFSEKDFRSRGKSVRKKVDGILHLLFPRLVLVASDFPTHLADDADTPCHTYRQSDTHFQAVVEVTIESRRYVERILTVETPAVQLQRWKPPPCDGVNGRPSGNGRKAL